MIICLRPLYIIDGVIIAGYQVDQDEHNSPLFGMYVSRRRLWACAALSIYARVRPFIERAVTVLPHQCFTNVGGELRAITRHNTYYQEVDAFSSWGTLVSALCVAVDYCTDDQRALRNGDGVMGFVDLRVLSCTTYSLVL